MRLLQGEWAGELLHGSGEMSARLLIIAMMLTPLRLIFPRTQWLIWLRGQRRTLGVAAFIYAVLHTLFYLIDMETLANVLAELGAIGIWTGWLATFLFVILGATSNDWSTQTLGPTWQVIHNFVYVAALLTLMHWIFVHNNATAAWVHFAPLILLEIYRVTYHLKNKPKTT